MRIYLVDAQSIDLYIHFRVDTGHLLLVLVLMFLTETY
jgi:hypothetical protein